MLKIVYIAIGITFIVAGFLYYANFNQFREDYPRLQQSMGAIPMVVGAVMIAMQFFHLMKAAKEAKNKSTLSGA